MIFCAAAVAVPTDVTAVTSSFELTVVTAEEIPETYSTSPSARSSSILNVGCWVTSTPVAALPVVGVPSPVITEAPLPLDVSPPVATVLAVPRVGAVPLPPDIMSVVDSFPVPIAKLHVEAAPADVTLGTVVVSNFCVVPGYDLTNVSVPLVPTVTLFLRAT